MKKLFAGLVVLTTLSTSYAGVCRDKFVEKKENRQSLGMIGTGIAGVGVLTVGATLGSPFLFLGTASYLILAPSRPKRLVRLIDESQSCNGKILNKAYSAYLKQKKKSGDKSTISKTDFCEEIVRGDTDGSLCPYESLPSIKNVGRHYID